MKKFTSIDYLRALSMIFIVGYWHLFDYSPITFGHEHPATTYVTHVVLSLFVFISGFLLGGKSTRSMSAMQFYKKRLLRIYPLYVLAIALFYLYGINDGWTSFKGLLGISMLLQPAPLTLWFITMLVLFYFITPVLLAVVPRVPLYFAVTGGLLAGVMVFQFMFSTVDPRLMMYFPSFCMGIFCANHRLSNSFVNPVTATAAFILALALTSIEFPVETFNYLAEVPLVAGAAYLIFYVSIKNEHRFKALPVVSFLSYSSFAIYLFHRVVYTSLISVYFPDTPVLQVVYLMTVGFFLAAVFSWGMQRLYDMLFAALQKRWQPPQKVTI